MVPAQLKRRPILVKQCELLVGRRGETPLVPPDILCNFILDGAVGKEFRRWHSALAPFIVLSHFHPLSGASHSQSDIVGTD